MTNNIEALFPHCVLPIQIVEGLTARLHEIEHIYVVAVTAEGKFVVYGSGDLSRMSDAALLLTRLATMNVAEKQEDLDE
jgi:hypothetical protein